MTDVELEKRLRDWYRSEIPGDETAPPALRSRVSTIPRASAASSRRFAARRGFTLLAAAARVGLIAGTAVVVCGLGFFTMQQRRAADRRGMAETLAAVSEVSVLMCLILPPAENAEPAPVRITTRTRVSRLSRSQTVTNSSIWGSSESALRSSGRFIVSVTIPSCSS